MIDVGRVGVWWSGDWTDAAPELEALGYGALWSSGGFDPGLSPSFERLLSTTRQIAVASGIVSVWATTPEEVVPAVADLQKRFALRFVLGIGASHSAIVEGYTRPYAKMVSYLDGLDALGGTSEVRVLAALGDRMLRLAGQRSLGAHPYFVPAEHTSHAREVLGPGPLLAPEVTVVVESEASTARETARGFTRGYLQLPNYVNNLRRFGFDDDDVADGGSDRLVDAIVCWGDVQTVARKVGEHFAAGADHVCVQVVPVEGTGFPIAEYRELAPALVES